MARRERKEKCKFRGNVMRCVFYNACYVSEEIMRDENKDFLFLFLLQLFTFVRRNMLKYIVLLQPQCFL